MYRFIVNAAFLNRDQRFPWQPPTPLGESFSNESTDIPLVSYWNLFFNSAVVECVVYINWLDIIHNTQYYKWFDSVLVFIACISHESVQLPMGGVNMAVAKDDLRSGLVVNIVK